MASVVAFIDARIGDPTPILNGLPPDSDWYVLATGEDGIGQMRRLLVGYVDLAAIHVFSHGGEGALYLGGTTIDADGLAAQAMVLADIGSALSEDGDLLLYGCDVGRGAAGARFVDALAGLTGADVAASSDATGSTALGGNWTLEAATGPIETATLSGSAFAALLAVSVAISPQQAIRPEGGAGPMLFTFALIRAGDVGVQQTLDWSVGGAGDHPADATDFGGALPSGTTTFAVGEVNKIVAVSVSGDTAVESDEAFVVSLSKASGGLAILNGSAGGTIQNDDTSTVTIAPLSAAKAEGTGGTTSFTFTVGLDQASTTSQTTDWTVSGAGADAADATDFGATFPSDTVTFVAGETSKTITVWVLGDTAPESNEDFAIHLLNPSVGLSLGTGAAKGTILDDDPVAPSAVATITALGNDTGTPDDFITSVAVQTVIGTFTGALEPDERIQVSADGGATWIDAAAGVGTFSANGVTLLPGTGMLSVRAVDMGNNTGGATLYRSYTLDTAAPSAMATIAELSNDTGTPGDFMTGVALQVVSGTLAGTLEPGERIQVSPDGGVTWVDAVAGSDAFAAGGVMLSPGTGSLSVRTIDAAGNTTSGSGQTYVLGGLAAIAAIDATRAEGNGGTTPFTFLVSVSGDIAVPSTLHWQVERAINPPVEIEDRYGLTRLDFPGGVLPEGTLTFSPGQASQILVVDVQGDTAVELEESFALTLSNPSVGLVIATASATGTILNDDVPVVSISAVNGGTCIEGGATDTCVYVIALDRPAIAPLSVQWSVGGLGPSPVSGLDFVGASLPSGTVTFAAGEASRIVAVQVADDSQVEPVEGFGVSLSSLSAGLAPGTLQSAGTILDDDAPAAPPTIQSIEVSGSGIVDGTGVVGIGHTVLFTVTMSEPVAVTGSPALGLSNGAFAVYQDDSGAGFTPGPSWSLTVQPGQDATDLRVSSLELLGGAIRNAAGVDADLSGAAGYDPPGVLAVVTTAEASLSPSTVALPEGDSGTTPFVFAVSLAGDLSITRYVSVLVDIDSSDLSGGSITLSTLTFAPGETSKTITVEVAGDSSAEAHEGFTVTLFDPSPGLTLDTASADGIILNDDVEVSIAAIDAARVEGDGGAIFYNVNLESLGLDDFISTRTVQPSLRWQVTGTGADPADASDFAGGVLPSGVVTFAPGDTNKTITVSVGGDSSVEADEGFAVTLSSPSPGLTLGTASVDGRILNDDRSKVFLSTVSSVTWDVIGSDPYHASVTLDQAPVSTQTVLWSTVGSGPTPASASDFVGGTLPSGTLTFMPGETSKTIALGIAPDALVEPDEGFAVSLSGPSAGLVLGAGLAVGGILNDDASVSIAAADAVKAEGDTGATPFAFELTRLGDLAVAHGASWSVTGSGAHPAVASDFSGGVLPSGVMTFAIGETSRTLVVLVAGDAAVATDEVFSVILSDPSTGLTIGTGTAQATIVNDDLWAHDDAYVVQQGKLLTASPSIGLLANDLGASSISPLASPAHGTLHLTDDGSFTYTPAFGYLGVDAFSYRARIGDSDFDQDGDGQDCKVYVVPVSIGATTTLDLLALTAEEQIAATYATFFGRAPDAAGFAFWLDQFSLGQLLQEPARLFANIASSFAVSEEATSLYPFLTNPFGASDDQIGDFLDHVYDNLFGRASDAVGLAYWTGQIKQTLAAGRFVGSVLVDVIGGAQNTAAGSDITTVMSKVAVGLHFVQEQQSLGMPWKEDDSAAATALLHNVSSAPASVLVGIAQADTLVLSHFASWSMDVKFEGEN